MLIMILIFFQTNIFIYLFTSIIGLFEMSKEIKFLNNERSLGRVDKFMFDKFN